MRRRTIIPIRQRAKELVTQHSIDNSKPHPAGLYDMLFQTPPKTSTRHFNGQCGRLMTILRPNSIYPRSLSQD